MISARPYLLQVLRLLPDEVNDSRSPTLKGNFDECAR